MKMFAGRETDLRDVRSVIVRQGDGALDWGYIESNLQELAELGNDPEIVARLRRVRQSVPSS
jgi:hypothetical protein